MAADAPQTPTRAALLRRVAAVATAAVLVGSTAPGVASAHAKRHRPRAAAPQSCAGADLSVSETARPRLAQAVVCLVNRERQARGLPALVHDARLDRSAQSWSDTMVTTSDFSHGSSFAGRITAAGFHWSGAAENIAAGFSTPAAVVHGWMASAGHCANILSPALGEVGTGVSAGAIDGVRGAWTQDFGLLVGQSPASRQTAPMRGCPYR